MDKVFIEGTPTTPQIQLDGQTGYIEISGKSLPENSIEFFHDTLLWVDNYATDPANETSLVFRLEYFNTSSTSQFLKLIKKMEKLYEMGKKVKVSWYYDYEDEDMKEAGEDFQLLVKVPIEIMGTDIV